MPTDILSDGHNSDGEASESVEDVQAARSHFAKAARVHKNRRKRQKQLDQSAALTAARRLQACIRMGLASTFYRAQIWPEAKLCAQPGEERSENRAQGADMLDDNSTKSLEELFFEAANGGPTLTLDGFRKVLACRGLAPPDEETKILFDQCDANHDGVLTLQECQDNLDEILSGWAVGGMRSVLEPLESQIFQILADAMSANMKTRLGMKAQEELNPMKAFSEVVVEDLEKAWEQSKERAVALLKAKLDNRRTITQVVQKNSKFSNAYASEGVYMDIKSYREGIEESVGLPEKNIYEGMCAEFTKSDDSNTEFKTSNYGGTLTTPAVEWGFVVNADLSKEYTGDRKGTPLEIFLQATKAWRKEGQKGRHDTPLEELSEEVCDGVKTVLVRRVVEAGMRRAFLAAAAASRPVLKQLSKVRGRKLEGLRKAMGKALREASAKRLAGTGQPAFDEVVAELGKACCEFYPLRREEVDALVETMREQMGKVDLWEEEVIALRLYTGPAYMKLNGMLRKADAGERGGNTYVCTIFAAVSGMVKLTTISPIPKGRKVYRGQRGMWLPGAFWKENAQGAKGGTELGFLSTTTELEVALSYAQDGDLPTVFEVEVGAVDKGASLGFLSQYPDESEILMPPRSFLEVVGKATVIEATASDGKVVPVRSIPVKINCNQHCPTLEKIHGERKTMLESALEHISKRVTRDVNEKRDSDEVKERAKLDWSFALDENWKSFIESITKEPEKALELARQRPASWYNMDRNFRQAVWEALEVQRKATGKLHFWIDDQTQFVANLGEGVTAHDCDRRAAGQLRRLIEEAKERGWKATTEEAKEQAKTKQQELALKLCLHLELMQGDDVNGVMDERSGETALMVQAGAGNVEGVEALLMAGANVAAVRKDKQTALMIAAECGNTRVVRLLVHNIEEDVLEAKGGAEGNTALTLAASLGHTEVLRVLCKEGNANVAARNEKYGQTAVIQAASDGNLKTLKVLVDEFNADVNEKSEDGATALHFAALSGHLKIAKWLVESAGADPKAVTQDDRTPLHYAALNGQVGMAKWLVESGYADHKAVTQDGSTPLHWAAGSSHVELAKWLVESAGADPMAAQNDGDTPLHLVAANGDVELAKWLVESAGADPSSAARNGHTPLHDAAIQGHLELAKWLVESGGADPEAVTEEGCTLLCKVADNGQLELMKWLVESLGADSKAADTKGRTALHHAAQRGHIEVARWLVEKALADPNASAHDGTTAFLLAAWMGHLETVQWLVGSAGADPKAVDRNQRSALHLAVANGQLEMAKWLVKHGDADPTAVTHDGSTPLHRATFNGEIEVAKWLVEIAGADPKAKTQNGCTPFHHAAQEGHLDLAKWLLDGAGADPKIVTQDGRTPLHMAASEGHSEVAKWLVERCAADPKAKDKNGDMPSQVAASQGHEHLAVWLKEQCQADLEGQ